MSPLYRYAS